MSPAPLPFWSAERPRRRWRAAAEEEEAFAEEAFAAVAVASIAAVAVASMAAEAITAEAMATMAWVRAAGGMSTASASAGGDLGSIAVAQTDRRRDQRRAGQSGAPFLFG